MNVRFIRRHTFFSRSVIVSWSLEIIDQSSVWRSSIKILSSISSHCRSYSFSFNSRENSQWLIVLTKTMIYQATHLFRNDEIIIDDQILEAFSCHQKKNRKSQQQKQIDALHEKSADENLSLNLSKTRKRWKQKRRSSTAIRTILI